MPVIPLSLYYCCLPEQIALHRQPWAAAFSSNKPPTTEFTRFEFYQHLGSVPKALRRKKIGVFCIRELGHGKGLLMGLDF